MVLTDVVLVVLTDVVLVVVVSDVVGVEVGVDVGVVVALVVDVEVAVVVGEEVWELVKLVVILEVRVVCSQRVPIVPSRYHRTMPLRSSTAPLHAVELGVSTFKRLPEVQAITWLSFCVPRVNSEIASLIIVRPSSQSSSLRISAPVSPVTHLLNEMDHKKNDKIVTIKSRRTFHSYRQ